MIPLRGGGSHPSNRREHRPLTPKGCTGVVSSAVLGWSEPAQESQLSTFQELQELVVKHSLC